MKKNMNEIERILLRIADNVEYGHLLLCTNQIGFFEEIERIVRHHSEMGDKLSNNALPNPPDATP